MLAQLGATIRRRRKELGLTQEDLAALVGVSDRTLREIERGNPSPSMGALANACAALGLTLTVEAPASQEQSPQSPSSGGLLAR